MLKKITLFLTTPLRHRMTTDLEFASRPHVLHALSMPMAFVAEVLRTGHLHNGQLNQLLGRHFFIKEKEVGPEGRDIVNAVHLAHRMESTVGLVDYNPRMIELSMRFYRNSTKTRADEYFGMTIGIDIETGDIPKLGTGSKGFWRE